MEKVILPDSPSFVDLCTHQQHQHAMRYYRLWIYACNIVLAVATLVFTVFAVSVLVDPRLKLLSGVEFYQPTFLYAYVALLLQCGVLQAIGCLGALRLNQKLLNTYWTLLLVLMIGDIIVGLVWAFRLDRIKSSLRPSLRQRLASQYKVDPEFTQVWDWIQSHDMCCGVDSPFDYPQFNESFTRSYEQNRNIFHEFVAPLLPSTCCTITSWDTRVADDGRDRDGVDPDYGSGSGEGSGGGSALPTPPSHHTNNYASIFPHFVKTSTHGAHGGAHSGAGANIFGVGGHIHHGGSGSGSASGGSSREQLHRHQQHHTRTKPSSSGESDQQQHQQNTYVGRRKNPAIAAKKPTSSFSGSGSGTSVEFAQYFETRREARDGGAGGASTVRLLHSDDFNAKSPLSLPQQLQKTQSSSRTELPGVPAPAAVKQMTTTSSTTTTTTAESGSSLASGSSSSRNNLLNSICVLPPELVRTLQAQSVASAADETQHNNNHRLFSSSTTSSPPPSSSSSFYHVHQHHIGCGDKMLEWIDHVTDVLFVIGFCIIVFLKGCFLAILRYEIKEMIQKIRLLNGDEVVRSAAMNELLGLTSIYGTDETSQGDEDEDGGNTDGQGLMSGNKSGGPAGGSAGAGRNRGGGRRGSGSGGTRGRGSGDGGGARESTTTTTTATTTTTVMLSSNENTCSGSSSNSNGGRGGEGGGLGSKPLIENHIGSKPASATPVTRKKSNNAMIIEEDFDSAKAMLEQLQPDNTTSKSKFSLSLSVGRRESTGPPRSQVIPIPVPRNGNNNIQGLQGFQQVAPPPPPHRHTHSHSHRHGSQDSTTGVNAIPMVNFTPPSTVTTGAGPGAGAGAANANRNELSTGSTTTTSIQ